MTDERGHHGLLATTRRRLGALPACILAGAVSGAVFGGVAGRILMRLIFLIDRSHDGAQTDFATAGEITLGGTATLLVLCIIFGTFGGAIYVGIRRWLPWRSPLARGAFLGLLMMFGPTILFLGRVDLQTYDVYDNAGTCLSADDEGGCGLRTGDE